MTKIEICSSFSVIRESKPIVYKHAVCKMQHMVDKVISNELNSTIWLLEHFPVYTAGYTTFSSWIEKYSEHINGVELIESDRGGKITFHGPGQRICYLILDLRKIYGGVDLSAFLEDIHQLIISVLAEFNIRGIRDKKYPGVWVENKSMLKKIAAIGIKIRKGVSYHGFALNINTDMQFFNCIEPCGISEDNRSVISMKDILGITPTRESVDNAIQHKIKIFSKKLEFLKKFDKLL